MEQPVATIAASRPEGQVAQQLRDQARIEPLAVDVDWTPLPDRYLIGEGRYVERLTTQQFLNGIAKKTLFRTALDLSSLCAAPLFIVEGFGLYELRSFHPNAIRGALSALILEYGASVLRTGDAEESAGILLWMAQHAQFGVPEVSLARKRKATGPADEQRRVVEMLPGIGFTLARLLLQTFGSIRRIVGASPEQLAVVKGLSQEKATRILEVLDQEYCAVDTEDDIERIVAQCPELLFERPVRLLDRQHGFRDDDGARLVADLVFADDEAEMIYIVELKRGALLSSHVEQLARYLDSAFASPLLRKWLQKGYGLAGILAAPQSRLTDSSDERIAWRQIDTDLIARRLMEMRLTRLRRAEENE